VAVPGDPPPAGGFVEQRAALPPQGLSALVPQPQVRQHPAVTRVPADGAFSLVPPPVPTNPRLGAAPLTVEALPPAVKAVVAPPDTLQGPASAVPLTRPQLLPLGFRAPLSGTLDGRRPVTLAPWCASGIGVREVTLFDGARALATFALPLRELVLDPLLLDYGEHVLRLAALSEDGTLYVSAPVRLEFD
jgi:hypothetical protein